MSDKHRQYYAQPLSPAVSRENGSVNTKSPGTSSVMLPIPCKHIHVLHSGSFCVNSAHVQLLFEDSI